MNYLCGKKNSKKPFGSSSTAADADSDDDGTSYGFVKKSPAGLESSAQSSPALRRKSSIRATTDRGFGTGRRSLRRVSFRDEDALIRKENIPCRGTGSCRFRRFIEPSSLMAATATAQQRVQPSRFSMSPSRPITATRCFDGTEVYDVLPRRNVGSATNSSGNYVLRSSNNGVQRSISFTQPSSTSLVCGHYLRKSSAIQQQQQQQYRGEPLTSAPVGGSELCSIPQYSSRVPYPHTAEFGPPRFLRPPCYSVAVRRAASFSAASNRHRQSRPEIIAPLPSDSPFSTLLLKCTAARQEDPVAPSSFDIGAKKPAQQQIPYSRGLSSSTSDLYVDSLSLRRCHSRDLLSAASSTSSVSEATVYKRVGPSNYVGVSSDKCKRKSLTQCDIVSPDQSSEQQTVTDLENADKSRPLSADLNSPRTDSYRFSMANLEDSQDVDLDAILGELCALESQYKATTSPRHSAGSDISTHRRTPSTSSPPSGSAIRTESPDNDSAFSDSVSLFSSESSTSSSTTPSTHNAQQTCSGDSKAEKIRLALQKMKEANVKKLFVKVFSKDGSTKSLLVDESMKCGYVMRLLADKHHVTIGPRWGLVEHLPELYMERVYEEHESLVDNLMLWTRDSKNKLLFVERPERLLLFQRPEIFHPDFTPGSSLDDEIAQQALVEEYLSNGGLPNVEGALYIKVDSRKGWKKYHSVLRASGLYYYKDKASKSSKDLACLATFDVNQVYYGVGWKKKFKAPTEHCFAIKHPCLQQPKSTKYIKYLCAEDALTLHKWVTAIRMVKYGRQLLENYQSIMTVEECELSDSGSSGCDVAFESDFPCGTIKRKPPKLPLTATTRQLAQLDTRTNQVVLERVPSFGSLPPPPPELLASSLTLNEEAADLPPPPPPPRLLPPPSETFLQDLQRVMRRKWQVAQKCKQDLSTTPHEVLGFRDPPDYRETNVSNWVAEHYGGQNLYENVYNRYGSQSPQVPVVPKTTVTNSTLTNTGTPIKKRPPPPPPPRAETTHLTTTSVSPVGKLQRS